jgi:septal ring factor EnvC (AmiA/AmiB activator)
MRYRAYAALCIAVAGFTGLASAEEVPVSETMDASLGIIARRVDDGKKVLEKKVKAYHALVESPEDTPEFVFLRKDASLSKRKAQALRLMELSIRYALEELDRLEIQKSELMSEIEWRRVQESASATALTADASGAEMPGVAVYTSKCQVLPLDVDPLAGTKILQDFGPKEDVASGLKWESHGWWIGHIQSPVRACRPGRVSFVGTVPGRGRVVIVDHGQGGMTLYANMKEENSDRAKVGTFVATGSILGEVGERLYFEVRQNGRAVSPREVFNGEQVAKLKF